jgi:hypothetical protein
MGPIVDQANDEQLTSLTLKVSFVLDLCVQTKDTRQRANGVYTRRATASWAFDGSGTVARAAPYAWTPQGASVTKPGGWVPVDDGSQPAVTKGPVANERLAAETFRPAQP